MFRGRAFRLLLALIVVLGGVQMATGSWIHFKALIAQQLLERAWQQALKNGEAIRPWASADTWPVARLRVPRLEIDSIVLAGDNGQALAFGPGHAQLSAAPGQPGTTLISGHRDTHFRFLKDLKRGDEVRLADRFGNLFRYRVAGVQVVNADETRIISNADDQRLVLATCWPFDALAPRGSMRYLVIADPLHTSVRLLEKPSTVLANEPSAVLVEKPSAVLIEEPSAVFIKKQSAVLMEKPS